MGILLEPPRIALLPALEAYISPATSPCKKRMRPRSPYKEQAVPVPPVAPIEIPPPTYYDSVPALTRVLKRLSKANRVRYVSPIDYSYKYQVPHIVVNIGKSSSPTCYAKHERYGSGNRRGFRGDLLIFTQIHPTILFTIAVFIVCVGSVHFWPL